MTEPAKPYTLTAEAWACIRPIIEALSRLRPPARLPVSFNIPEQANRARDWLYKYFKEMNLKPLYQIRRDTDISFMIHCKAFFQPIITGEEGLSPAEAFVQKYFIKEEGPIPSEEEANAMAQAELDAGKITAATFIAIMDEYRRILGIDKPIMADIDIPDAADFLDKLENPVDSGPDAHVPAKKSFDILDESIKRNDADTEGGTDGDT